MHEAELELYATLTGLSALATCRAQTRAQRLILPPHPLEYLQALSCEFAIGIYRRHEVRRSASLDASFWGGTGVENTPRRDIDKASRCRSLVSRF